MTCDGWTKTHVTRRHDKWAECFPNSVVTLGILTLRVKGLCVIEVSRGRVRLIRCYFQHIHASRNPRSAFRLRRLAESGWPRRVLGSRRSAVRIFVHGGHFS